jgi:hypothetical protein
VGLTLLLAPMPFWPFDLARAQYAQAVQSGLLPRSLIASARFDAALSAAERLFLGRFARST